MKKIFGLLVALTALVALASCGHEHDYKKVEAKDATCTEDGNKEYYTCSGCDLLFVKNGEEYAETTKADVTLAKLGHNLTHVPAKAATDEEDGNVEYWECGTCHKKFSDANATTELGSAVVGKFTMRDFLASTQSLQWNPLTWETSDDSAMLGYLSMGFYDYWVDVDENGNSKGVYKVVCEMAEALPVDVTDQYVGRFGVAEGETAKAWRIALNKNAKWQDGTNITADDYIYSMQQQLDGAQMNRRADSYYGGDFSYVNAQAYLYSGKEAYIAITDTIENLLAAGVTVYFDAWNAWNAQGYLDGENGNECPQYLAYNDTTVYNCYDPENEYYLDDELSGEKLYNLFKTGGDYASYAGTYTFTKKEFPVTNWDEVGFVKVDDYTIDIIIENSLEQSEFYLPYHLSSTCLVKKDLYEASWEQDETGARVNTYGKKLENTISYGPYKMVSYEDGKQIKFTKNENWYGWTDDLHVVNGKRLYQTTDIQIDVIRGHETQLLAFKKGEIDGIGLQASDLEELGQSKYKMLTPQSYTTKLTFNTSKDALQAREVEGKNKTMLTVREFRQALALCFDRADFCAQFTAGHTAGFGLFNYMYQIIGSDGVTFAYRDTDGAKEALCKVFGLEYGEGKRFATLDEAYKAITGYDLAAATAHLKNAIATAKEEGIWNGTDNVELEFAVYQGDQIYQDMFNFFDSAVKEMAKGTELEGKISLTMKVDEDYYNTMYAGKTDIIFSTWGGAQYGTLGMMSNVYVDDYTGNGNQMEIGFNTDTISVTYKMSEELGEKTFSLKAWCDWLNNKNEDLDAILGKPSAYSTEARAELLGELEYAYLNEYCCTAVYYRQTVSLHSMKINYAASDYIDLVGFGGLSQITYNYTDAEWNAYVASQGGELVY